MKHIITLIYFASTLFFQNLAFAHGENEKGPHGGYIRMPGAFHTEVVKAKNGFRVYLIDINWKNPSVLDSDVKAEIKNKNKIIQLECTKENDSYLCKSKNLTQGELSVFAKREGQQGAAAVYKLPLKLEASTPMPDMNHETQKKSDDHSSHQPSHH